MAYHYLCLILTSLARLRIVLSVHLKWCTYTASDRVCVTVCFSCCNNLSVSFSCNTLNAHLKCNTLNAHLKCNTLMLQHFSYNTLSEYKFPPDDATLLSATLSSGDHVCVKVSFSWQTLSCETFLLQHVCAKVSFSFCNPLSCSGQRKNTLSCSGPRKNTLSCWSPLSPAVHSTLPLLQRFLPIPNATLFFCKLFTQSMDGLYSKNSGSYFLDQPTFEQGGEASI